MYIYIIRKRKKIKYKQQLSKASAPHNPPQQLSKRSAGFAMVLPRRTFTADVKTFTSEPSKPSDSFRRVQALPCASLLAPQAVSIGLRNCRVASHLRLPSGPAGIRTTTGSLSALARPTPHQLSHRVARQGLGIDYGVDKMTKPAKLRGNLRIRMVSWSPLSFIAAML